MASTSSIVFSLLDDSDIRFGGRDEQAQKKMRELKDWRGMGWLWVYVCTKVDLQDIKLLV